HPLALHHCPTRRSSDLFSLQLCLPLLAGPGMYATWGVEAFFKLGQHRVAGEILDDMFIRPAEAQRRRIVNHRQRAVGIERDQPGDRKSTRLNSSHVKIS